MTKPDENRRRLLKITGAGILGLGALSIEEVREAAFGPNYVEEGEVNDTAREAAEDEINEELESHIFKGLDPDIVADAYMGVQEAYSTDVADRIMDERIFERYTDGDLENAELLEMDFRYGPSDAVESKYRVLKEYEDGEENWSQEQTIDDTAAEAFYDQLLERNDEDELLEQYGDDEWI